MNTEVINRTNERNELAEFAKYFLKYLNGSATFEEAFVRAANLYRKRFKKIPYDNCESFLSDFYRSQHEA